MLIKKPACKPVDLISFFQTTVLDAFLPRNLRVVSQVFIPKS